jgi:hypothetical protein
MEREQRVRPPPLQRDGKSSPAVIHALARTSAHENDFSTPIFIGVSATNLVGKTLIRALAKGALFHHVLYKSVDPLL